MPDIGFYFWGFTICSALVAIVYYPLMRGTSISRKVGTTASVLAVSAVIAYANWGYEPSYNSGVLGVFGPALLIIFGVGWIGCSIIDLLLTVLNRSGGRDVR